MVTIMNTGNNSLAFLLLLLNIAQKSPMLSPIPFFQV